jgi:hypothetical protein
MSSRETTLQRAKARARARGFTSVAHTFEASVILVWLAVLVVGERMVSDATTARRSVEKTTEQSVIVSAASYCEGTGVQDPGLGFEKPKASLDILSIGKLDVGKIIQILMTIGLGKQKTFDVYTADVQLTHSDAQHDRIRTPSLFGGSDRGYAAQRSLACLERSLDTPQTSVSDYRKALWLRNIAGF